MEPLYTVLIVFGIVLAGYFISKLSSRILFRFIKHWDVQDPFRPSETFQTLFERTITIATIIVAILFLGENTGTGFVLDFMNILPQILLAILLLVLGSTIISVLMWFLKKFLHYLNIEDYVSQESQSFIIPALTWAIRVFLYVVLLDIVVSVIDVGGLQALFNFILYPVIGLFFVLAVIAAINPMRDISARLFLNNMVHFRPGNEVYIDGRQYSIKRIHTLHTELTDSQNNLLIYPHRLLANMPLKFKRPMKEIDTLEDLQQMYVAQMKSHCGPASAQMALSIFNHHVSQQRLGKLMHTKIRKSKAEVAGTHPQTLIDAVERVTHKKVRGAWIGMDHIFHLRQEILTWLNQGGLVIVDYKKNYLFPNAQYAHYSLVVGVRSYQFLIVDPSSKSGGVYFTDYRDMLIGMDTYSPLIGAKRGYIVLAPEGTEAYDRIKNNIIYGHASMYDYITKKVELYLSKLSHPQTIKSTIPHAIRKRLRALQPEEQVQRVWRPPKKE